jgi:quercetin dioxygenase-like cupin family protein
MDAVIHNAGVMSGPVLAVNVVAPYLLTALIERPQRLIYLSSSMHRGGRVSLVNIESNRHSGSYSDSKLLVTTLAMAVARLWARSSTSNSRSTRPPRATARWTSATQSRCSCGREPVGRPSRPLMKRFTGIGRATEGGRPMQITRDIETQKGPADWFTGDVYIDGVAAPAGTSTFAAALVHFTPGARTAWHTHPHGQTIFVTEGVGLCQREGGPIETIRPGDRVFFEPGENHWHGAAANRFMVHIAMQQNDESGSPVTWGEHVADEQYGAARAEG